MRFDAHHDASDSCDRVEAALTRSANRAAKAPSIICRVRIAPSAGCRQPSGGEAGTGGRRGGERVADMQDKAELEDAEQQGHENDDHQDEVDDRSAALAPTWWHAHVDHLTVQ
jgi:hypothetical protein